MTAVITVTTRYRGRQRLLLFTYPLMATRTDQRVWLRTARILSLQFGLEEAALFRVASARAVQTYVD